ncbi:prephenate dehydratase [Cellulosimicrobium marinum]|uniref:prephenate dehydratase n=1 Tax=Cellulosimicrobium marinum TaxID=1638992 RepID=UPI001E648A2B|nr:prephenate dehydratase domain-containing protein [Cellulosimicrobium marinum]MCB7136522.1 prephenate dehydratase [Cellulosimicrobium marinum]
MSGVGYLGPQGTFTHQAAAGWAVRHAGDAPLVALGSVADVFAAVADGSRAHGVVAIENTVEGYVVPSLDAIVGSDAVVAVDEVVLDISFDAFVRPDHGALTEVSAHPHGLAQCQGFVTRSGLRPVPAASNAAACRDAGPHQVALGPSICGELYGLQTHERAVEDFAGARTRFLVLAPRAAAPGLLASARDRHDGAWRTMLAVTPVVTGPGVLARITRSFGERGVNMSSLITRPLKRVHRVAGAYVFVLTVDGAPWEPPVRAVLADLLAAGDSLKTLGVVPVRGELDEPVHADVDAAHVPVGSVAGSSSHAEVARGLLW